jgi:hypothetical protein
MDPCPRDGQGPTEEVAMELEELVQRIQRWKERNGTPAMEQPPASPKISAAPPPVPDRYGDTGGIEPVEAESDARPDNTSEMSLDEVEEVKEYE